ncbi:uncharacterized protein [Solanum lycopersicum]|uniref:uncharacterized protein n=1 Tax=Solanum lycopersicum TaxID=4081 RepID=UPI0037480569
MIEFFGSETNEDPQNILDDIKKFFELREENDHEFMNLRQGNMIVQEYVIKFNKLSRYAPYMVAESKAHMNKFLCGVSYLVKTGCKNSMLLGDMNISTLMAHAQQVESISLGNIPRRIRTLGLGTMTILSRNWVVEITRKVNRSFQLSPLPQLVFHHPRTSPASRPNQQGNSSSTGGSQQQNKLYALQAHQDQKGSPSVVTSTLRVFDLDFYALLDPGATLSFVTPYIAVNSQSVQKLSQNLSQSLLRSVTQL